MWRPNAQVRNDWFLALGVAAVAALARLRGLGEAPLWYDEIVTLHRAGLPFPAMVADALAKMHLPTYYALVGLFSGHGADAAALRLPSTVLSSMAAGVLAVLGRRVGGTGWTGAAAGLLFALSPFQVLYGQEARPYALVVLAVSISLAGLIRLVESVQPADDSAGWALWAGGTVLTLYGMTLGAPWLVVSTAVVLALILARPRAERPALFARAGLALGIVLVLWLPWLPHLAGPVGKAATSFWVPPATVTSVGQALAAVFLFGLVDPVGFEPVPLGLPMLGVAVSSAAVAGAWRLRRRRPVLLTLVATTLTLPLVLLAASWVRPVFIPRYLIWAALPSSWSPPPRSAGFRAASRRLPRRRSRFSG
jgi:mannosyltransferase